MVSTDEEADYGDDFEEASDDDGVGRKTVHGEQSLSRKLSKTLTEDDAATQVLANPSANDAQSRPEETPERIHAAEFRPTPQASDTPRQGVRPGSATV
jgi:hypothetical protein